MGEAISVKNLTKKYEERIAIDNVSFNVKIGSVCGFVGPNGSGKTTTIRAILGLIKPISGEIRIFQTNNPNEYLQKIGAMIEGPAFYPLLSGISNLRVLADLAGISSRRCDELITLVGLGDRANSKFKTYSLGMKQRLGIAAALLPNPELLILDEPTNGLDPQQIAEMRLVLKRYAKDGRTVIISSHLLAEVQQTCSHVVLMHRGKLIANPSTLTSHSQVFFTPALSIRSNHASSSSALNTLSSDIIFSMWSCWVKWVLNPPPTNCVGESSARSSGCLFSSPSNSLRS